MAHIAALRGMGALGGCALVLQQTHAGVDAGPESEGAGAKAHNVLQLQAAGGLLLRDSMPRAVATTRLKEVPTRGMAIRPKTTTTARLRKW